MRIFEGIAGAADAIREFAILNADTMPAPIKEAIQSRLGTGSSPVDLAAQFIESVYANREAAGQEALEIAAGAANVFHVDGFHGQLDGRAYAMTKALRRDSGEAAPTGNPWPKKSTDPDPKPEFGEAMAPAPGQAPIINPTPEPTPSE